MNCAARQHFYRLLLVLVAFFPAGQECSTTFWGEHFNLMLVWNWNTGLLTQLENRPAALRSWLSVGNPGAESGPQPLYCRVTLFGSFSKSYMNQSHVIVFPSSSRKITQDAVGYHGDSLVSFVWLTLRWHTFDKRPVVTGRHPDVLLPEESEAEGPEHQRQPQVHFGPRLHVMPTSEHQGDVKSAEDKGFTPAGINRTTWRQDETFKIQTMSNV